MVKHTTQGVTVSVRSAYYEQQSDPSRGHNVFVYHIIIRNKNDVPVQLLSRHWDIWDVNQGKRVVKGKGVIGQQPVIAPNDSFSYSSWCPLTSGMGYMEGYFNMISLEDNSSFRVRIPRFELIFPSIMN